MIELTGFGSVLRGIGVLYWLLATGALAFAVWKGASVRGKTIGAAIVILLFGFLPIKALIEQHQRNAYAQEAWAYFKLKCDTEAGEKIYKTFTDVKSVLVVKPLPPATEKDLYDQFWYGDPYSDATPWAKRAELAASVLAWEDGPISPEKRGPGFDFVESVVPGEKNFLRYSYPKGARNHVKQPVDHAVSQFGLAWEDISTPEDRKYWVAGSRLRIVDLRDNTVVAERIGYLIESGFGVTAGQRRPWLTARGSDSSSGRSCPQVHDYSDRWFVLKVLNPIGDGGH
jgi:hypothetical protein